MGVGDPGQLQPFGLHPAGGPVVSNGMVYVQSGNAFSPYPNEHGHVFLAYVL